MIKKHTSWNLRSSALGVLFPIFLLLGCSSSAQPVRPIQIATVLEPPPQTKGDLPYPDTATTAEQSILAEIDEKNGIFFSLGSSTIDQRERKKLRYIAALLKSNKTMYTTLTGHANDNGSSSFNLAVADARVESIVTALRKSGVPLHQIKKKVVGGEKTSNACRSTECRRKMRRVEFAISTSQ